MTPWNDPACLPEGQGPLKIGHYGVILADPPWTFKSNSDEEPGKNARGHYDVMDMLDIMRLPVRALAAKDCALFLWGTQAGLEDQMMVLRCWDFQFKSAGGWGKLTETGENWHFGTGFIWRSTLEFILVGTRGRPQVANRDVRNLLVEEVREHSRKPEQIYGVIDRLHPDVPKVELFARQRRPGFDVWGLQANNKFEEKKDGTPTRQQE